MSVKQKILFQDLGIMDYQIAWEYQEKLLKENLEIKSHLAGYTVLSEYDLLRETDLETTHHLLFVEHPPVYTLGKSGKEEHVLINEEEQKELGVQYFKTNRGGDITFHGPQQIVGYPILDLEKFYTDIGKYLRNLEEVIIQTLAEYNISAGRSKGETGVWIDPEILGKERKICAIGVRCSRWVTMHGFAFNVNNDLTYFNHIIPCGIANKQVTSLGKELGLKVDYEEVKERLKHNFAKIFEADIIEAV